MINRVILKFGPTASSSKLTIEPTSITVFVGPNNSGKSKIIGEIAHQCIQGGDAPGDVILDHIEFDRFDESRAGKAIEDLPIEPKHPAAGKDFISVRQGRNIIQIYRPSLFQALLDPNDQEKRKVFSSNYLKPKTLVLNGRNRIDLVREQPGEDLLQPAKSSFQKLFKDDALRSRLSKIVQKSLESYLVIDPTKMGSLRLRLSLAPPPSAEIERGLGEASVTFHNAAQDIAEASDGAKAFIGIMAEILAGDPKVLLMDEPEAFLHPALSYNLGREVAQSLAATDKRMFVSTHSPQFLMGCIQSGVSVNVVRLTYRGGVPTARLLPSVEIIQLMRNPLLRSVGVISALFYESVVVTEADPDRAFYQEINERLLRHNRGIPNCVFLNAQNKQTIPTIVGPLRSLGIPTAAVYDIDLVKDGGSVAAKFMQSAGFPGLAQQALTTMRSHLAMALQAADAGYKTNGGIGVLANSDQLAANDFFNQLADYGVFVVRGGELESWLKPLAVTGKGPPWLISIFEQMGEDPASEGYIKPAQDDVWKFIDDVAIWLVDPRRKGIPA
jgi:ABC-type cobalamin/Fe3+-siderophores transport system ATPase subunit